MDLKISEMMAMQEELYQANKEDWSPIIPSVGKSKLLWMIEEVGEVISIIKKKSEDDIMNNPTVREAFVEEMADVLMYYQDVLRCYQVSSEEISNAYMKKHRHNLERHFKQEHAAYLKKENK
ncbi:MazG nucleotide pyrophosphohydrolase domain-containing protein [Beduini massiliensis]|uniref:MazG nucleotide pyrophosphohydrolase domain-containing protein n=1 Tax=Beduini massiliensis TaxID=1585974 RepID=UPI00059A89D2|nr:MazG nucleotide pyrophosphohydrolase domain-containing protein [Beduini massiliensis]